MRASGCCVEDLVADRLDQVRLAEPDAAVDKERVVRSAGVLGDLDGRRARELVRLAGDEAVECEAAVEARALLHHRLGVPAVTGRQRCAPGLRAAASTSRTPSSRPHASAARRSMRAAKRSRTSSSTKRLGAARVSVSSGAPVSGARGRIQVLNCCAGSSCSSRRRQASQRFCIFYLA